MTGTRTEHTPASGGFVTVGGGEGRWSNMSCHCEVGRRTGASVRVTTTSCLARRWWIAAAALVLLFAGTPSGAQEEGQDEPHPDDGGGIDEDVQRAIRDHMSARHKVRAWLARIEAEHEEETRADRQKPLPFPIESPLPAPLSVAFAVPRARAWLAASQSASGAWGESPTLSALASRAIIAHAPRGDKADIAELRVYFARRTLLERANNTESRSSLRCSAIALWGQANLVTAYSGREAVESLVRRARAFRIELDRKESAVRANEIPRDTAPDTAWSILALSRAAEVLRGSSVHGEIVEILHQAASRAPHAGSSGVARAITGIFVVSARPSEASDRERLRNQASRLLDQATSAPRLSLEEWFLATHAMEHATAIDHDAWTTLLHERVLSAQSLDGAWGDPLESTSGERIRDTALALLSLSQADVYR